MWALVAYLGFAVLVMVFGLAVGGAWQGRQAKVTVPSGDPRLGRRDGRE